MYLVADTLFVFSAISHHTRQACVGSAPPLARRRSVGGIHCRRADLHPSCSHRRQLIMGFGRSNKRSAPAPPPAAPARTFGTLKLCHDLCGWELHISGVLLVTFCAFSLCVTPAGTAPGARPPAMAPQAAAPPMMQQPSQGPGALAHASGASAMHNSPRCSCRMNRERASARVAVVQE